MTPYGGYEGEYPELYTVAIASIPEIRGYSWRDPEPACEDPKIRVLEADEYGRVMFVYTERYANEELYLLIMQKADDCYSYYYQESSYTIGVQSIFLWPYNDEIYEQVIADAFPENIKNAFKELNDWGMEIDDDKLVKAKISIQPRDKE